jgi:DNA invertase Pin-like site-specific DNA recombinase
MGKVFGYGRHSTHKQGATEEVQQKAVTQYFSTNLQPESEWGGWHYDAATSGSKPFTERPEGLKLWMHLQRGDYLIVSKLDRAFRSLIDGANTLQMLKAKGVNFVALDLGIDSSTTMGEFALNVFLAAAQMQRRYASERTKEVLALKAGRGQPIGRAAASSPYGWRRVGRGASSHLTPDEAERGYIETMQNWRDAGLSLEQICFRTSEARHLWSGITERRWYPSSVSAALMARAKGFPKAFMRSRRACVER